MNPNMTLRATLSLLILSGVVSLAGADDAPTSSARPAREAQATPVSLTPATAKTLTERSAVVKPELRRAPMSKNEQAIFDVQENGRNQVSELQKQIGLLPDSPARRALELKVIQVKRDTEILVLRTISAQAIQRGDLAASREANDAIEMILSPKAPATTTIVRPAPGDASNR